MYSLLSLLMKGKRCMNNNKTWIIEVPDVVGIPRLLNIEIQECTYDGQFVQLSRKPCDLGERVLNVKCVQFSWELI
jgi:hypothetical protein